MAANLCGKPIVTDGLVFHIDPANTRSLPVDKKTDPLTSDGIKDMNHNISSIGIGTSYDSNGDLVSDTFTPGYNSQQQGNIVFTCLGAGSGTNYKYGFLDLGTPVNGVTKFGETDCYTVEFWWKQGAGSSNYIANSGHILGHKEVVSAYTEYTIKTYTYGSFDVEITGYENSGNYNWVVRWNCGQKTYTNSGINPTDQNFYGASHSVTTLDYNNGWHSQACVFDLGNSRGAAGPQIYQYRNGYLASGSNNPGVKEETGSASWLDNTEEGGNIYFGASNRNTTSMGGDPGYGPHSEEKRNGAKGQLGTFKIYNRALTSEEMKQNYNALKWRYH